MALDIPAKMKITLPAIPEKELCKLYSSIRRKFSNNLFAIRLRMMIGAELKRRESDVDEPGMEVLQVNSGVELSHALEVVREMATWKLSQTVKRFVAEVLRHVYAMVHAFLEVADQNVFALRNGNTTNEAMLRASECAALLHCSEQHLKKLVDAGSFPQPFRVAGKRFWMESSVHQYLKKQSEKGL